MKFAFLLATLVACGSSNAPRTINGITISHDGSAFRASDGKFEMLLPESPSIHPDPNDPEDMKDLRDIKAASPTAKFTYLGSVAPANSYMVSLIVVDSPFSTAAEISALENGVLTGGKITDVTWSDSTLAGLHSRFATGTWHEGTGHLIRSRTWFAEVPTQKRIYMLTVYDGPKGTSEVEAQAVVDRFKVFDAK